MIKLFEIHGHGRKLEIAMFDTYAEAMTHVAAMYTVVYIERDPAHKNCADFITNDGRQFVIEPGV